MKFTSSITISSFSGGLFDNNDNKQDFIDLFKLSIPDLYYSDISIISVVDIDSATSSSNLRISRNILSSINKIKVTLQIITSITSIGYDNPNEAYQFLIQLIDTDLIFNDVFLSKLQYSVAPLNDICGLEVVHSDMLFDTIHSSSPTAAPTNIDTSYINQFPLYNVAILIIVIIIGFGLFYQYRKYSLYITNLLQEKNKFDIFLSYSKTNRPFVRNIYDHLKNQGFKVWYDEYNLKKSPLLYQFLDYINPEYSSNLVYEQEKNGINNSKVVISCRSSSYEYNELCMKALKSTIENNKQIFIIKLEPDIEPDQYCNPNYIYDFSEIHRNNHISVPSIHNKDPEWGNINDWSNKDWVEEFYILSGWKMNDFVTENSSKNYLKELLYKCIDESGLIDQLSEITEHRLRIEEEIIAQLEDVRLRLVAEEEANNSYECCICYDQNIHISKGLYCRSTNESNKHFYCNGCFKNSVESQIGPSSQGDFICNNSKIVCDYCKHQKIISQFSNNDLITHTDDNLYNKYNIKCINVEVVENEKKNKKEYEEKLKEYISKNNNLTEERIKNFRHQIENEFLTDKCPNKKCNVALDFDTFDFNMCMAIRCDSCNKSCCGWCFQDCGTDSHAHVKSCTENPMPNRNYFTTKLTYTGVQNKRKKDKIDKFISVEVPNDLTSEVKKSIACFYDKLK
jgi:hypothetical protein